MYDYGDISLHLNNLVSIKLKSNQLSMEIMAIQYTEGFHKTSGRGGKQWGLSFCGLGDFFIQ